MATWFLPLLLALLTDALELNPDRAGFPMEPSRASTAEGDG